MTTLAPHDGTLVPGELRPWRRPLVRGLADGAHVLVDRVVEGERRHGPRTPPDVPGPLGHGVVALDPHPEAGRVRRRLLPQRVGDVPPGPRGVARRVEGFAAAAPTVCWRAVDHRRLALPLHWGAPMRRLRERSERGKSFKFFPGTRSRYNYDDDVAARAANFSNET